MPKDPINKAPGTPPTHFAPSLPDPSSGSPFVFTQLMELAAAFARVEQKVDDLKETVKDLDKSVHTLEHTVSKARGAMIVGGVVFTLALAALGWLVTGDVKLTVGEGDAVTAASTTATPKTAPPVVP